MTHKQLFYIAYSKTKTIMIYSSNITFFIKFCKKNIDDIWFFEVYKLNSNILVIDYQNLELLGLEQLLQKKNNSLRIIEITKKGY